MVLIIKKIINRKDNFSPEQLKIINNSIKEISKYPLPNKDICSKKVYFEINKNSKIKYIILYEIADKQYENTNIPFPSDCYIQNETGLEKIVEEKP